MLGLTRVPDGHAGALQEGKDLRHDALADLHLLAQDLHCFLCVDVGHLPRLRFCFPHDAVDMVQNLSDRTRTR